MHLLWACVLAVANVLMQPYINLTYVAYTH